MHYIQNIGYVEASGKKVCSKRQMHINLARVYGYHGDTAAFTRLICESRVNREALNESFRLGAKMKQAEATALVA